jgi:PEGA domain
MEIALARLPAPPAMGTLQLDATPADAALTLDGTEMGSASDFRQELSAGAHLVEISAAGYESRRETVTIAAGGEQPMQVALARLPPPPTTGTLVLDVTTPGAVLILDGKRIGLAKGFRRELPAGVHKVQIEARGYHTDTKTLTLTGGELTHVPFTLIRRPPQYSRPVPPPPVIQPSPPPVAPRKCFLFFCG